MPTFETFEMNITRQGTGWIVPWNGDALYNEIVPNRPEITIEFVSKNLNQEFIAIGELIGWNGEYRIREMNFVSTNGIKIVLEVMLMKPDLNFNFEQWKNRHFEDKLKSRQSEVITDALDMFSKSETDEEREKRLRSFPSRKMRMRGEVRDE